MPISSAFPSFGEYLSRFMERRGYSGAALAQRLGEKSATLISRIRADQCSPARCETFLRQLHDALGDLTEEDDLQFRRGIAVLELGKETYSAYRAIHQLFTRTPTLPAAHGNLLQLLRPPVDASVYDVVCMQCADPVVTDALAALPRGFRGLLSIHQYVTFPLQTTSAQLILSLLPILCDVRYTLTELRFPQGNPGLGITAQQFILTRTVVRGEASYQLLIPCSDGNAHRLPLPDDATYAQCRQAIDALDCEHIVLNDRYAIHGPTQVLDYLTNAFEREQHHAMCQFRPDFPFSLIAVDVLQGAFNDMLLYLSSEYGHAVTDLRRLCFMRHRAISSTSQPLRMLFSRGALQQFMKTGRLSNHFFGLRPFTPDERRQIIAHVIALTEANPNIQIYLAQDDTLFQTHNYFIYEKSCVYITPTNKDYLPRPPADGIRDALLRDAQLVEQMTRYFTEYLLPYKACSQAESLAFLRSLLNA